MNVDPYYYEKFETRHIGPDEEQINQMLNVVGTSSLAELINQTVPSEIRLKKPLNLPQPQGEITFLSEFKKLVSKNRVFKSFIGQGYYNTAMPTVILRNILENPGWYSAYTPYQAEISQGRLEALFNYQTMVVDIVGLPIANASLLDEATAAAEAMIMLYSSRPSVKKNANRFFVDQNIFRQTFDLLRTRSKPIGIELVTGLVENINMTDESIFGLYIQNPNSKGAVFDYSTLIEKAHSREIFVAMGVDLMSLALLKSPGEMGADVAIGSTQRFGVPMGFGGPHAAFFATNQKFKRLIPGRIIGLSVDSMGNPAFRMALQTREQHIRRERATSNICTSQVLLAIIASMYAVYHGADGLNKIAKRIYGLTKILNDALKLIGYKQTNELFFDTLNIKVSESNSIRLNAEAKGMNFSYHDSNTIGISIDEVTSIQDIKTIIEVLSVGRVKINSRFQLPELVKINWPTTLLRSRPILAHPVFRRHHSETGMLRYIKQLENKDLSLVHSMISLGSCTMKLNATTEMIPATWNEIGNIHPFAPKNQVEGYLEMIFRLEHLLGEITGFNAVSLQPNSGAQGEYTGLLVIKAYHDSRNENYRNVALIPASAHGTNPASAVMSGMKVIVIKSKSDGTIDIEDLESKSKQYSNHLSCLMITYPSTHGVFEENITLICEIIHHNGGLVYMDGANMNAQVGITSPAKIGVDACHLNLHKTFCIPHGGGGPGVGPICVNEKLKPFLPSHHICSEENKNAISAVSASPWGSASILCISYAYITMMGTKGLTHATSVAILNANYLKDRLKSSYKILYTGKNGRCAHEFIVDCREFKKSGIEVEDIAKRLIDYGFHAPTVSFPVAGTLMIEPTESESKDELDKFCEALIGIRNEIRAIEEGIAEKENNVLKMAPHTSEVLLADKWNLPYSRKSAAYPLPYVVNSKFWPSISRVENAYGDRNLICSCIPINDFEPTEKE